MRPNWKLLKHHPNPAWSRLYASLSPKGEFRLSRFTWEKLKSPPYVQILFDVVNNRIAIKPVAGPIQDTYPVHKQGSFGGRCIYAFPLMGEHRIELPITVEFPDAYIDEDNYLVLDLRTAITSGRALGHLKRRANRDAKLKELAERNQAADQ